MRLHQQEQDHKTDAVPILHIAEGDYDGEGSAVDAWKYEGESPAERRQRKITELERLKERKRKENELAHLKKKRADRQALKDK